MKKIWWLLALPYAVSFSSTSLNDRCAIVLVKKTMRYEIRGKQCDEFILSSMLDEVFALNEAHERRTRKVIQSDLKKPIVTNQQACGQDDCGAE